MIAHSFLGAVDEAFITEGAGHQFSRYMDDIAIGASSYAEGMEFVSREQRTPEKLGLYPNAAKTRVIPSSQFLLDYMKEENDYLGDIDQKLRDGVSVDVNEVESRLDAHVDMEGRPKAWERVLRRYATLCRQLRSPALINRGIDLIPDYPGSARSILDYAATFAVTVDTVARLRAAVSAIGPIYEDIRALPFEFLAVAPVADDPLANAEIVEWAKEVFYSARLDLPRLGAVASLLIAKFGGMSDPGDLAQVFRDGRGEPDAVRRQLLVLALASGQLSSKEIPGFGVESAGMAEAAEFLVTLTKPERRFVEAALSQCKPRERKDPRIWMIPPRGLFLGVIAVAADTAIGRAKIAGFMNLLNQNDESHRDRAGARWLTDAAS